MKDEKELIVRINLSLKTTSEIIDSETSRADIGN